MKKQDLAVSADMQLEKGIFRIGHKYYVMTPSYHYVGILEHVDGDSIVLTDCSIVFESGPYDKFFAGEGTDVQKLLSKRTIIDRGGSALHEWP